MRMLQHINPFKTITDHADPLIYQMTISVMVMIPGNMSVDNARIGKLVNIRVGADL